MKRFLVFSYLKADLLFSVFFVVGARF